MHLPHPTDAVRSPAEIPAASPVYPPRWAFACVGGCKAILERPAGILDASWTASSMLGDYIQATGVIASDRPRIVLAHESSMPFQSGDVGATDCSMEQDEDDRVRECQRCGSEIIDDDKDIFEETGCCGPCARAHEKMLKE
jgi:hypothetical protein